ncbi:heat shock factor-binding protein 1-like [Hyalella azteca]|uniref:Heat shock factor-binding protein 1 n=1 Tax=Hyalella azteca TaxID=294128 RepID=A0A8B7P2A5_HYAAZ|nr:heat shock factor-binding protein 1-like [Hyalella azteca]
MADSSADLRANNLNAVSVPDPKNVQDLSQYVAVLLQQMQDRFQIMSDQIIHRIDEMGNRIDDLEKNISDMMAHAGSDDSTGEK